MTTEKLVDKLTEEQIENNLIVARRYYSRYLNHFFEALDDTLYKLIDDKSENNLTELADRKKDFIDAYENVKKDSGFEFQDFQKKYNAMMPRINEYLKNPEKTKVLSEISLRTKYRGDLE